MTLKDTQRKVALITGGGRGIGAATAKLLAERNYSVAVMSRTEAEVRSVVDDINKAFGAGRAIGLSGDLGDVGSEASVEAAFRSAVQAFGRITTLVNCAGAITNVPILDCSRETWDGIFAVNVLGSFLCTREFFRHCSRSGTKGSIVNVSSLGGIRSTVKFPGFSAYTSSKHAVVGLTEASAVEGKELGIRVNCIAPGAVDTVMLRSAAPSLKTRTRPEDVAKIVAFLCDDDLAHALTGSVIEVNTNE